MAEITTARSTICWYCGNKLWSVKIFKELFVDRHSRILHKTCAKEVETGGKYTKRTDWGEPGVPSYWSKERYET